MNLHPVANSPSATSPKSLTGSTKAHTNGSKNSQSNFDGKLVVDANVVISALIADSKTRECIVTLEPDLCTFAFVHDELGNYEELIVEKSGMTPDRVTQFIDLLFQYIKVVPASEFYPYIEEADAAIGDTDPDDVLYVACALAIDADIWSDDSDFEKQSVVEAHSTSTVIDSFDTF